MITEDQLEQLCLTWFQSIGYDIALDGDATEHSAYHQDNSPLQEVKLPVLDNMLVSQETVA